jgi:hypothetical protein
MSVHRDHVAFITATHRTCCILWLRDTRIVTRSRNSPSHAVAERASIVRGTISTARSTTAIRCAINIVRAARAVAAVPINIVRAHSTIHITTLRRTRHRAARDAVVRPSIANWTAVSARISLRRLWQLVAQIGPSRILSVATARIAWVHRATRSGLLPTSSGYRLPRSAAILNLAPIP